MDELNGIWEKYSSSGWAVGASRRKPYLDTPANRPATDAGRDAEEHVGDEYRALYKRMLAQKDKP